MPEQMDEEFINFVNSNPEYTYYDVWKHARNLARISPAPFSSIIDERQLNHAMFDENAFLDDIKLIAIKTGIFAKNDGIYTCTTVDIGKLYVFSHELMKLRIARILEAAYGSAG